MAATTCENCRCRLEAGRDDKRFCSARCRVAAHRRRGKRPPTPPPAVNAELPAIDDELEAALVSAITSAAFAGDWKAAAWYLERAHPARWSHPSLRGGWALDAEPVVDDPFAEIDELAAKRRRRRTRDRATT
jgi:hypothetical protein